MRARRAPLVHVPRQGLVLPYRRPLALPSRRLGGHAGRVVTPPTGGGGGGEWPNLPGNFTVAIETDWTETAFTLDDVQVTPGEDKRSADGWIRNNNGTGNTSTELVTISSGEHPTGGTRILRHHQRVGIDDGFGPEARWPFGYPTDATHKWAYLGFWLRMSPSYQGHDSGVNKVAFIRGSSSGGGSTFQWTEFDAIEASDFRIRVVEQGGTGCGTQNWWGPNRDKVRNQWYRVEILHGTQTVAVPTQASPYKVWVDGDLEIDTLICANPWPSWGIVRVYLSGIWGGNSADVLLADQWQDYADVIVAYSDQDPA